MAETNTGSESRGQDQVGPHASPPGQGQTFVWPPLWGVFESLCCSPSPQRCEEGGVMTPPVLGLLLLQVGPRGGSHPTRPDPTAHPAESRAPRTGCPSDLLLLPPSFCASEDDSQ